MTIIRTGISGAVFAAFFSLVVPAHAQDPRFQMKTPNFSAACTPQSQAVIKDAAQTASAMLNFAMKGVADMGTGRSSDGRLRQDQIAEIYRNSFGSFSAARHKKVAGKLKAVRVRTWAHAVRAHCEPQNRTQTCIKGAWAHLGPQQAYQDGFIIDFCPAFFAATTAEVRKISNWPDVRLMRAGVFLHELMHFNWEGLQFSRSILNTKHVTRSGAKDHEYDTESVKYLAETDPETAIENADSYHVFVMNLYAKLGAK